MTAETVYYFWPSGRRLYCRPCSAVTVHDVNDLDPAYVQCAECRNDVLGAQVVSLYSSDDARPTATIPLPLELRSDDELITIARRIINHRPALGNERAATVASEDPMFGLQELLRELGG